MYFARGQYNIATNIYISGARHPLKLSRSELGTVVDNFIFIVPDQTTQSYAAILLQGVNHCLIKNGKIYNNNSTVLKVQSHPSDPTDLVSKSSSVGNQIS